MRTLYLDTSSSFLYCGVVEDDNLVFSINKYLGKEMSKYTLYEIEKHFKQNNIEPKSINKIILVNGPGSFTGVRIAITIVKTYAWSFKIPVIVISSLLAIAISYSGEADFIIPVIDARRGFCYSGIYDNNLNLILKDQYINLETLKIATDKLGGNFVYVSNDDYSFEHKNYEPNILKIVNKCKNFNPINNVHLINANYLKATEAEEKLCDNLN